MWPAPRWRQRAWPAPHSFPFFAPPHPQNSDRRMQDRTKDRFEVQTPHCSKLAHPIFLRCHLSLNVLILNLYFWCMFPPCHTSKDKTWLWQVQSNHCKPGNESYGFSVQMSHHYIYIYNLHILPSLSIFITILIQATPMFLCFHFCPAKVYSLYSHHVISFLKI